MANKYYNNTHSFTPGTLADGTAVDAKFDGVTAGFDQADVDIQRAIKLPAGTSGDQVITQDAVGRADKAVGFDNNGNLTLHPKAGTSAAQAAASAQAAATSEANAANSATAAANSASAAATSETNAANSATAAANSASAAATSETNAANYAHNASLSNNVLAMGSATGGSATSITDSSANWDINAFMGTNVVIERNGSAVRTAIIKSNDATTLFLEAGPAAAAGDSYRVIAMGRGTFSIRSAIGALIRVSANVIRNANGTLVTVS